MNIFHLTQIPMKKELLLENIECQSCVYENVTYIIIQRDFFYMLTKYRNVKTLTLSYKNEGGLVVA